MSKTKHVQVYIPPQKPAVTQNPHLGLLEKRLGVMLENDIVTAAFNRSFFNGDRITHLNDEKTSSLDSSQLQRILKSTEKVKVTIATKHGIDDENKESDLRV